MSSGDNINSRKFNKQLESLKETIPVGQCRPVAVDIGGVKTEIIACRHKDNLSVHSPDNQSRMQGKFILRDNGANGSQDY